MDFMDSTGTKDGPFKFPLIIRPRWRIFFMKLSGKYFKVETSDGEILIEKRRRKR